MLLITYSEYWSGSAYAKFLLNSVFTNVLYYFIIHIKLTGVTGHVVNIRLHGFETRAYFS